MKNKKIGIIGIGMVGGMLARYFKSTKKQLFLYDKYKKIGSPQEINKANIIFICVPTPTHNKNGFDLSAVNSAFRAIQGNKTIVIKSTVLPDTTDKYQKKYPQHKIIFNPEFLSEKTAYRDLIKPDIQIIGHTAKSATIAKEIIKLLPKATFEKIIPAKEAELFKYFHNAHGALKVVFANELYDLCQKLKINYENIIECASASKHILTSEYLRVNQGDYRGYGGSCFPKDIRALIRFGKKNNIELKLLQTAEKINNQLLRKQGIKT